MLEVSPRSDPSASHMPHAHNLTRPKQMTRPRLPLAAISIALLTSAAGAASVSGTNYFYSYDKTSVPLALDATRIAVFKSDPATRPDAERAAAPSLAEYGISSAAVTQNVVRGWSFAALNDANLDAVAIETKVDQIAADPNIDFVSPVFLDSHADPYIVTRDILVGFPEGTSPEKAREVLTEHAAGEILIADFAGLKNVYRIRTMLKNGIEVLDLTNALAARNDVAFAEPDALMTARKNLTPNDTNYNILWGLHNTGQSGGTSDMDMDAPEAWDISTGNASIIVGVLDDGVQDNHPDINQVFGADFTGQLTGGAPGNSCDNHGTAVAGCVSAIINNSQGVVGIAPTCKSMSLRFSISNVPCNGAGTFQPSWLADALAHAVNNNVRVTNTSSGFSQSSTVTVAFQTSGNSIVHFVSSGNSGVQGIEYPAALSLVNAVGACNRFGNRASFSTYGPELEFVAPGQDVYTTDRTGALGYAGGTFTFVDGTSFSSPYAAGVAALILSVRNDLSPAAVSQLMKQTCVDRGTAGFDNFFGFGIINARAALVAAPSFVPPTPGAFNLISPANGASGVSLAPLLDWSPASTSDTYLVTLDDNPELDSPLFSFNVTLSQLQLSNGTLTANQTYYWAVTSSNEFGTTVSNPAVASFNTNTTPPPGCAGDTNGDGDTNGADLSVMLANFGNNVAPGTNGDLNDDGIVNGADLSVMLADFGCVN